MVADMRNSANAVRTSSYPKHMQKYRLEGQRKAFWNRRFEAVANAQDTQGPKCVKAPVLEQYSHSSDSRGR